MAGNPLGLFEDLIADNSPAYMSDPKEFINDAQKYQEYYIGMEAASNRMADQIQAGPSMEDRVFLSVQSRVRYYNPSDDTVSYNRSDNSRKITQNWGNFFTYVSWSLHEVRNKFSETKRKGKGHGHLIRDFIQSKYDEMWTDLNDTLERDAFVSPDADLMIGENAKMPMSLPYFLNEFPATLYPGFEDVQGIDPRTEANWRNHVATYAQAPGANWDFYLSLSEAMRKTMFKRMPHRGERSAPETKPRDLVILTDSEGFGHQEQAIQTNQDLTRRSGNSNLDAGFGDSIEFRGADIVWCPALDDAEIYNTMGDGTPGPSSSTAGGNAGPRYMGINTRWQRMVWHSDAYMQQMEVQKDSSQPWSRSLPFDSQCNRFCRSRRNQFMVTPSQNI